MRSQRAKVARNGKSRGGGGELFSDKSRSWHLLSILTILDGKMLTIAFESIFSHYLRLPYLTNKEALTVLCSLVKHAGSGENTKEV